MIDNESYIALGSNQNEPISQIQTALQSIAICSDIEVTGYSKLYSSKTVGPAGQPDCINAVIKIITSLDPESLLDRLQDIEINQQRVRTVRWGPRTIDLDILLYNQSVINTNRLIIPHKEIYWRSFVLLPLSDISPNIVIPNFGSLTELLAQCHLADIKPLNVSLILPVQ